MIMIARVQFFPENNTSKCATEDPTEKIKTAAANST